MKMQKRLTYKHVVPLAAASFVVGPIIVKAK